MTGKNQDFAAYMPSLDCSWIFTLRSESETIAETYNYILDISDKVWDSGNGFLIPTDVSFILHGFNENMGAERIFETQPTDTRSDSCHNKEGVSFNQLAKRIGQCEDEINPPVSISEIKIESATTILTIGQQEVGVNQKTGDFYKWMRHDEPIDREPSRDPITVTVCQRKGDSPNNLVYKIIIDTHTPTSGLKERKSANKTYGD